MGKTIIGGLVAGLILFIWQFLSWGLIDLHVSNMKYTPNQDKILNTLNENLEPGTYFLPRAIETASQEEAQKAGDASIGKPWAQIYYHHDRQFSMGSNMFRGFVLDFLIGLLLCWLFLQFADPTFGKVLLGSLAVGIIGYLSISYLNSVWFQTNSLPDLLDAVVGFGVVGLWLGWWLNR